MIVVLAKGILYGLVLAMLIGPVFFALIRTSIDKGFKSGAFLALGISLSDSLAALLVYFGISQFTENEIFQTCLGLIGGVFMIGFGLAPFLRAKSQKNFLPSRNVGQVKGVRYVIEGMLLNLLNPFVYFFWLTVLSFLTIDQNYNAKEILVFFLGAITTVLSTDIAKAYVAHKITKYLTPNILIIIDRAAGIGLIAFGIRLFVFALYNGW